MLYHPTLDKLQTLRLTGMHQALIDQLRLPDSESLSFEERLGLLVDREMTSREDRRLQTRLRKARLKQSACIEDLDYRSARGLDKALMAQLAGCQWVREGLNLIINGPTGVGKTWIACALAHNACREGYSAQYLRLPRLFEDLALAHGVPPMRPVRSSHTQAGLPSTTRDARLASPSSRSFPSISPQETSTTMATSTSFLKALASMRSSGLR